jgi:hypothetical protein
LIDLNFRGGQAVNIQRLRKSLLLLLVSILFTPLEITALGKRRPPPGGRVAIVVDERLSALRTTPELSGQLVRRIGRGGLVAIRGEKRNKDGILFYKVNVTSRTSGWIQRDAIVCAWRSGDDARLLRLIKGSADFDRIARARIFLDNFRQSELRPEVLMIHAEAAEDAAGRLSHDAPRRLDEREMKAGGAPEFSYFLNFNGPIALTVRVSPSSLTPGRRDFITMAKAGKRSSTAIREVLRQLRRANDSLRSGHRRLDELSGLLFAKSDSVSPPKRTNDNSPPIYRWDHAKNKIAVREADG